MLFVVKLLGWGLLSGAVIYAVPALGSWFAIMGNRELGFQDRHVLPHRIFMRKDLPESARVHAESIKRYGLRALVLLVASLVLLLSTHPDLFGPAVHRSLENQGL